MEVAADAAVIARSGSVQPLARALLKVLEHPTATTPVFDPSLALSALSPTAARIDCLTHAAVDPYPPLSWAYFSSLATALAVPTFALVALAAASNLHYALHPCHIT